MSDSIVINDNAVDFTDVTLALVDTGESPEHRIVLAAANSPLVLTKLNANQDSTSFQEVLNSSSSSLISDSPAATVGSIILPHHLNLDNIQQKLVNNASLPEIETRTNKNSSVSIQLNASSYYVVAVSLFKEWVMLLDSQKVDINLAGIPLTLINAVNHLDKGGSTERSLVRLSSTSGQVTVTFYNTTHLVTVQGSKQAIDGFAHCAFVPFINKQLEERANEINTFSGNLPSHPRKTVPDSPTRLAAAHTPLPPSPIGTPLALETNLRTPPRRIDLRKSQILPDTFFLESMQESPEKADQENSVLLQVLEEEQLPSNSPRKSVIVFAKQTEGVLGGGAGNQVVKPFRVSLDAGPTTNSPSDHLFPKVSIIEIIDEDEVVHVEDEKPYQCGTCAKTFEDEESVNVHIENHTTYDLEQRMEKLEKAIMTERRTNAYKIELLEHKVEALESQLKKARQAPPPAQPLPCTKFFSCNTCGHRAPTIHTLNAHMASMHSHQPKTAKAPPTSPVFACNQCNYKSPSGPALKTHTSEMHQQTNKQPTQTTMMIGDSNMKTISCRTVEASLGGGKLLCGNHIASTLKEIRTAETGRPGSAYNSDPEYPGSRFRKSSFKEIVPQMLAKQPCDNLVLQSPANDLTNLSQVPEQQHQGWAEQSSRNMVNIAEQAISRNQNIKKVVLLEHLPRVDSDHLAALANHSNSALRQFAASSIFSNQIFVASHSSLNPINEEKTIAIFGPRNRGDGIHLRGSEGPRRHTSSVISALQSVGIAGWSTQAGKGSAKPQVTSYSQVLKTGNRFQQLNL